VEDAHVQEESTQERSKKEQLSRQLPFLIILITAVALQINPSLKMLLV
jgi:hypothetical protein